MSTGEEFPFQLCWDDSFAFGLTLELITRLFKVSALGVTPFDQVLPYLKSSKSPEEIARELGVKVLVTINMRKQGSRVRLIPTLFDPFEKKIIWTEAFQQVGENIDFLQSERARAIISELKVAVQPKEKALLDKGQKVNPEACDLCMKGIEFYSNPASGLTLAPSDMLWQALGYFQKAVEIDPSLALAHSWVALLYNQLWILDYADRADALPKAREAVQKALELIPAPAIDDIIFLASAYALRGDHAEALTQMDAIKGRPEALKDQWFRSHETWMIALSG